MRRFLFIFWSLILSTSTFSQVLFEGTVNENLLKGRVKQIEEFIARFNNEEDWEGKKGNIQKEIHKNFVRPILLSKSKRRADSSSRKVYSRGRKEQLPDTLYRLNMVSTN